MQLTNEMVLIALSIIITSLEPEIIQFISDTFKKAKLQFIDERNVSLSR